MDREEQIDRFGEAVERKKEESRAASRERPRGSKPDGEESELVEQGPPDVRDERKKSSGHGGKTADKWNQ